MKISNAVTYETPLPERTIHTPDMPEGWITETYSDGLKVTWCPLNFEIDGNEDTRT